MRGKEMGRSPGEEGAVYAQYIRNSNGFAVFVIGSYKNGDRW
jgi:hypothetical protein